MKVVVAGGREFADYLFVKTNLDRLLDGIDVTEIVHGGARGVDSLADKYARGHGINVAIFLPEYNKYPKKSAPHIRNRQMGEYGNMLIAFWNGVSPGTKSMIEFARKNNLPIHIVELK